MLGDNYHQHQQQQQQQQQQQHHSLNVRVTKTASATKVIGGKTRVRSCVFVTDRFSSPRAFQPHLSIAHFNPIPQLLLNS
jgi:hypothetical protein